MIGANQTGVVQMICDNTDLWLCVALMAVLFAAPCGFLLGWLFSAE